MLMVDNRWMENSKHCCVSVDQCIYWPISVHTHTHTHTPIHTYFYTAEAEVNGWVGEPSTPITLSEHAVRLSSMWTAGPDSISGRGLKLCDGQPAPVFTMIFNLSLAQSVNQSINKSDFICLALWAALHTDSAVRKARQGLFHLRKFWISSQILKNFYSCTIKSVLTGNITAWYGNSTEQDRKALQREQFVQVNAS